MKIANEKQDRQRKRNQTFLFLKQLQISLDACQNILKFCCPLCIQGYSLAFNYEEKPFFCSSCSIKYICFGYCQEQHQSIEQRLKEIQQQNQSIVIFILKLEGGKNNPKITYFPYPQTIFTIYRIIVRWTPPGRIGSAQVSVYNHKRQIKQSYFYLYITTSDIEQSNSPYFRPKQIFQLADRSHHSLYSQQHEQLSLFPYIREIFINSNSQNSLPFELVMLEHLFDCFTKGAKCSYSKEIDCFKANNQNYLPFLETFMAIPQPNDAKSAMDYFHLRPVADSTTDLFECSRKRLQNMRKGDRLIFYFKDQIVPKILFSLLSEKNF